MQISAAATCGLLLVASNIFMTFAWYAHLKNLAEKPWWIAALASWAIALFEYLLMVPANRSATPSPRSRSSKSYGPAGEARLPLGGAVHHGCGVFHLPWIKEK